MKLNYYYEELFMESDQHSDEICVGSCIGCLFTPDEFYAVYNSDDHKTFRDRLVEITEAGQCTQGGTVNNAAVRERLKFSSLSASARFLEYEEQYNLFYSSRKELFQRLGAACYPIVVGESLLDQYLDAYQEFLVCILHRLADCGVEHEKAEIKQFLSKFMLIDCIKDYTENNIYVSWVNPLMLLQAKRFHAMKNVAVMKNDHSGIDSMLLKLKSVIMEKQFPDRVYSDVVMYTIDKGDCMLGNGGFQVARPRGTMSTLNNINSIRIIGKILRAFVDRESDKPFRVAYFGDFCDEQGDLNVVEYFRLPMVIGEYQSQYQKQFPGIELEQYVISNTSPDSLLYYKKKAPQECKDLQEMGSLEELMEAYDMILFLDEGYYYKKEYQDKKISFDRYYAIQSFLAQQNAEKANGAFKWDTLTSWMNWGFSIWGDKSGYYEFDENLYDNISNISKICRDNSGLGQIKNNTYVYIGEGKKIGKIDLTQSNVCEEELYYGHKMIVSHFPKKTELQGLDNMLSNEREPDFKLQIDAWKFMRSLYDEAYKVLWTSDPKVLEKEDPLAMVYYLKHIAIVWDYRALVMDVSGAHEIHLNLVPLGSLDSSCKVPIGDVIHNIKEFVSALFGIAFSDKKDAVSQYVHDAVIEIAKASAYWMEDFLFVNFLKGFRGRCEVFYECDGEGREERHLAAQTRQTVHAIVRQLDALHLREVSRNGFYIKRDIIKDIGGQYEALSIKQFDAILMKMKSIRDRGFNSGSLLKHNLNILCPDQEEIGDE